MAAIFAIAEVQQRVRRRIFRDHQNPLDSLDDEAIIARFRLSRACIFDLCQELQDHLQHPTQRSHALPVSMQLLAALRYYGTGTFLRGVGDTLGISKMTVSYCIRDVSMALSTLSARYINFPDTNESRQVTKTNFFNMSGFPNCSSAIDGTLIPILAPPAALDEPAFVCRKGYHAINVQAICNSHLEFSNAVVKWPGSTHDAFIWDDCGLARRFGRGDFGNSWLIGDSGYPLRPWMLVTFLHTASRAQERYNAHHKTARNTIERAFGFLKMRFRCLDKSGGCLMFSPSRCTKVILACMCLHNICVRQRLPQPDLEGEPVEGDLIEAEDAHLEVDGLVNNLRAEGVRVRQELVNNIFTQNAL